MLALVSYIQPENLDISALSANPHAQPIPSAHSQSFLSRLECEQVPSKTSILVAKTPQQEVLALLKPLCDPNSTVTNPLPDFRNSIWVLVVLKLQHPRKVVEQLARQEEQAAADERRSFAGCFPGPQ